MTRFPDLDSLALLVDVAEQGSLGRAARVRGISQPSASARIDALERRLRVPLLVRTTRGSTLTTAGELVVGWATPLLQAAEELTQSVATLQHREARRLAVAASLSIAEYLLPEWLVALHADDPQVAVELQVANSSEVATAVRERRAALGFIETPDVPDDLDTATVGTDRLLVVVAPEHPWARRDGRPLDMTTFTATPMLLREPGSGTRRTLEQAVGGAGRLAPPALQLSTTTAIRSAALRGSAPAVLSELTVSADCDAGRLVPVEVAGLDLHRTLRAVWRRDTRLDRAGAALVHLACHR